MRNDLDLIVKRFPNTKKWNTLRLYAIGDVHVGAENFDEKAIKKKIEIMNLNCLNYMMSVSGSYT